MLQTTEKTSRNTIITKLNESMLKDIAQSGGGAYIRANSTQIEQGKLTKWKLKHTAFNGLLALVSSY